MEGIRIIKRVILKIGKFKKINIDTINEIIDYLAFEEKSENEIILSTRFNSKKIVYLEHSIEVEKNNFKITPTNKLAEILFNEIENKRINVKILEDKLRTSKSNLTFFNNIVGQEFNEDVEILKNRWKPILHWKWKALFFI